MDKRKLGKSGLKNPIESGCGRRGMDVRSLAAGRGGWVVMAKSPPLRRPRGVPRGVRVAERIGSRFGGPCNTRRRLPTFTPFNSFKTITGIYFAAAALRGGRLFVCSVSPGEPRTGGGFGMLFL
jgi:hypothetical protein